MPTEETALLPQYVVEVQYFFGKARAGGKRGGTLVAVSGD